jgi:hypothetical protein
MRDRSDDSCATALVGTENLSEEDPKGHQRGKDPVVPGGLDFFQSLGDALQREHFSEGESTFLEELRTEEVDLTTKTSLVGVSHRSGSEPVMEVRHPSSVPECRYLSILLAVTEITQEI